MWLDLRRDGWRSFEGGKASTLPMLCCGDDDDIEQLPSDFSWMKVFVLVPQTLLNTCALDEVLRRVDERRILLKITVEEEAVFYTVSICLLYTSRCV